MITTLKTKKAELVLNTDQRGWCQLQLHIEDQILQLGADKKDVVVRRLSHALEDVLEGSPTRSIQGTGVTWVLSLSERHSSIYVAQCDESRVLFFQGEDGSLLARVELVSKERRSWFSALQRA